MERWLPVVGWEDRYEISSIGRLRNIETRQTKTPQVNHKGYWRYQLYRPEGVKNVRAHVVELEAFSGHRPENMVAMHINNDKTDNRIENLKWGTHGENTRAAHKDGLIPSRTWANSLILDDDLRHYFRGVSPVDYSILYQNS